MTFGVKRASLKVFSCSKRIPSAMVRMRVISYAAHFVVVNGLLFLFMGALIVASGPSTGRCLFIRV